MLDRTDALRKLATLVPELGDDELNVLVLLVERLRGGQDTYGRMALNRDSRDFVEETMQEVLDAQVYSAGKIIQMRRLAVAAVSRDADDYVEVLP